MGNDEEIINRRSTTTKRPVRYSEEDYVDYDAGMPRRRPEGAREPRQRVPQGRPPQGRPPQGRPASDPYGRRPGERPVRRDMGPGAPGPGRRPAPRRDAPETFGRQTPPPRKKAPDRSVRKGKADKRSGDDKKKKGGSFGKFVKALFVIVIILAVLFAGISYVMTKRAYDQMTIASAGDADNEALTADGVTNILLIGNDSRLNGSDGRSDAMILLSISKTSGKIMMTSFLRDMYVEIPGHGSNRLNAAYSFGGAELLMETIEKNFDIPVNRYILVNFEAFANVVDAVGGIDLELSPEEVIWVDAYLNEYNELTGHEFGYNYLYQVEGGMIHLNGPQALAYSRNRYIGTDFGRTERQRKVMEQIIKKAPAAVLTNSFGLIDGLCPNLTTNMSFSEVYSLVLRSPFLLKNERVSGSIPLEGTWRDQTIDSMMVLGVDLEANRQYLHHNLYEKPDPEEKTEEEESD